MSPIIYDLHNDLLTQTDENFFKNEIALNEKSGYKSVYALFKGKNDLKTIKAICEKAVALGVKDVAFEDACYEDEDAAFELICKAGARYASLCWNGENAYAGGCKTDVGLKKSGYRFINRLNSAHIPLDLAHASKKTFYEAIEHAERVLCSHAAFDCVRSHVRNLDDDMIKAIIDRGGLVGLTFVGYFLCNEGLEGEESVRERFFANVDCYLQKFGTVGLCIGSDFYGSDFLAFSGYRSFIDIFLEYASKNRMPENAVNDVLFGNALRFF